MATYKVLGMTCQGCANSVTKAIQSAAPANQATKAPAKQAPASMIRFR